MNVEDLKKSDFIGQVKKVLAGEIEACEIENIVGTMDEVSGWLEKELGDKKQELFILAAEKNKKDWPDQEADNIISSIKITKQENKSKI